MSQRTDKAHRIIADLDFVLATDNYGTAAKPDYQKRLDRAAKNLDDWAPDTHPDSGEPKFEQGGTSSPIESEDRLEVVRLWRQVLIDRHELKTLLNTMEACAALARNIVLRNEKKIQHSKLPAGIPGCVSCARPGSEFHAEVRPTAKKYGLCDGCYRFALAERDRRGDADITRDHWPPVKWCDLRHRVSAQAAGRWYAQEIERGAA